MGKKGEALQIVVVIPKGVPVKVGPVVQVVPFDQIDRDSILGLGFQYIGRELLTAQGNFQVF
ncbi:hypothetical protein ES703_111605 [subsurface metagenome]